MLPAHIYRHYNVLHSSIHFDWTRASTSLNWGTRGFFPITRSATIRYRKPDHLLKLLERADNLFLLDSQIVFMYHGVHYLSFTTTQKQLIISRCTTGGESRVCVHGKTSIAVFHKIALGCLSFIFALRYQLIFHEGKDALDNKCFWKCGHAWYPRLLLYCGT